MNFEIDGELVSFRVPLSDAQEFAGFVEAIEPHAEKKALRHLCSAAIEGKGAAKRDARATLARISRRVSLLDKEGMLGRCWDQAINDDLVVAVGENLQPSCSLDAVVQFLNRELGVGWPVREKADYYRLWDDFIVEAERKAGRVRLHEAVSEILSKAKVTDLHRAIARLPLTNFIDASLDRSLTKALREQGKTPIVHDEMSMRIGEWQVSDPDMPHVFYVLGTARVPIGFTGSLKSLIPKRGDSRAENLLDMLRRKDLLLCDFHPWDAEYVLRLPYWVADAGKIVNCAPDDHNFEYWSRRGVYVSTTSAADFVDGLLPAIGGRYGELDILKAPNMYIDLARRKPHDVFISYSRSDAEFVADVDRTLRRSGIRTWRDVDRMQPGNPISGTISTEVAKSHAVAVVLSPEALASDWVRREIEEALDLHRRGEIEILPILYRECTVPESLREFLIADLRDQARRPQEIASIATSVRDAAARAARKIR